MLFQQTNMVRGWQWETAGESIFHHHRWIQKSSALQWGNGPCSDHYSAPPLPHQLLVDVLVQLPREQALWASNGLCPVARPHRPCVSPSCGPCPGSQEQCPGGSFCSHAGALPKPGRGEPANTTGHKRWEGQSCFCSKPLVMIQVPAATSEGFS